MKLIQKVTIAAVMTALGVYSCLGIDISEDFNSWTKSSSVTTVTNNGWVGQNVYIRKRNYTIFSAEAVWLSDVSESFLRTPTLTNGYGTISFETACRDGSLVEFFVRASTNEAGPWTTVATLTNTADMADATWDQWSLDINNYEDGYIQIISTISAGKELAIDNVHITEPPAKVEFGTPTTSPGVPEVGDEVHIYCDLYTFVDASISGVECIYEIGGIYATNSMTQFSNSLYRTSTPIPSQSIPVRVNYEVRATYTGTNSLSPSTTSSFYDVEEKPFSSDYDSMQIIGATTQPMSLISNNLWQGSVSFASATNNAGFKFEGAHTNGITTNIWGDSLPESTSLIVRGTASTSDGSSIVVDYMPADDYVFFLDESTGEYLINSTTSDDFESWSGAESEGDHSNNGWQVIDGSVKYSASRVRGTNSCFLSSNGYSYVRTPEISDGIGYINFWVRHYETNALPSTECLVQASETGGTNNNEWTTLSTLPVISSAFSRQVVPYNNRYDRFVRVLNTTGSPRARIIVDDFMVMGPGAGVIMSNLTHSPSSPTYSEQVTISVDATTYRGASITNMTTYWRTGNNGAFSSQAMTQSGNTWTTTSPIPAGQGDDADGRGAGTVQYYAQASFSGYDSGLASPTKHPRYGDAQPSSYEVQPGSIAYSNVTHSPAAPEVSSTFNVEADIIPAAGASNLVATVFYRIGGSGSFSSYSMIESVSNANHFSSTASLPVSSHPGTPTYYYLRTSFDGPSALSPTNYPPGGSSDPITVVARAATPTSSYTNMSVIGDFSGQLTLVDDHTWAGIVSIPTTPGPGFRFKGTSSTATNIWGDENPIGDSVPVFGMSTIGESEVQLTGTYSNQFIFHFNETSGQFRANQCYSEDFNSFSLISAPSSSPTANAAGWSVLAATVFDTNGVYEGQSVGLGSTVTDNWSYARSPVIDGGIGNISFGYRNRNETGSLPGELNVGVRSNGGTWEIIDTITNILSVDYIFHEVPYATSSDNMEVQLLWQNGNNTNDARLAIDLFTVEALGPYALISNVTYYPLSPAITNEVTIEADISTIGNASNVSAYVYYRVGTNGGFDSTPMTNSGIHYTSSPPVPRGEAGRMEYYLQVDFTAPLDTNTLYAYYPEGGTEDPLAYTNSDNLAAYVTFESSEGWSRSGAENTQTNIGWVIHDAQIMKDNFTIFSSGNGIAVLTHDGGSTNTYVRSPQLPLGVGAIRFLSKNRDSGMNVDLTIQLSSNGETGWQTVATVASDTSGDWKTNVVAIHNEESGFLRIIKLEETGPDKWVGIDDIEISYPIAHVAISNVAIHPQYPADSDEVNIACNISSAGSFAPAMDITARVYYKLSTAGTYSASPVEMTRNGNYFITSSGIPAFDANDVVDYYIESTFNGYNRLTSLSPTVDPNGAPTNAYSYSIRTHESSYSNITMNTESEAIAMKQTDNGEWLGILSYATPATNVLVELKGLDYYDGTSVIPGIATIWGDPGQSRTNLPYNGQMQLGETNLLIQGTLSGNYLLTFSELTRAYTLRRGVYQDFNDWPAQTDVFEDSLNNISQPQQDEDFSNTTDWPQTVPTSPSDDFDSGWGNPSVYPPTNAFPVGADYTGPGDYVIYSTLVIDQFIGQAAMLKPEENNGWIRGSVDIPNEGTGSLDFDVRCADDTFAPALYNLGAGFTNVIIEATLGGNAIPTNTAGDSWGHMYKSILGHYVSSTRYYELRVVPYSTSYTGYKRLQLWEKDGADEPILRSQSGGWVGTLDEDDRISFLIYNNPPNVSIQGFVSGKRYLNYNDSSTQIYEGTKFGFSSLDADLIVSSVNVYSNSGSYYNQNPLNITDDPITIDDLGTLSWTNESHSSWVLSGTNYFQPGYIGPALSFTVDYIPTNAVEFGKTLDETGGWINAGTYSGYSNTEYVSISQTIDRPEDLFVRVKHTAGAGSLIIDNVSADYWHGKDFSQTNGWDANAVWVSDNAVELRTSRAYTDEVQYVRSPYLENGADIVEFDYKTATTPDNDFVFAVRCSANGNTNDWTSGPVTFVTNSPSDWTPFSWRLPTTNDLTNIFIRIENASDNWDAAILLDNIVITEPIPIDDNTWRGYNLLVTGTQTNRLYAEPDNVKGAYLNDGPNNDTGDIPLTNALPYIETARLPDGVGEIQFLYRAWDGNATRIDILGGTSRTQPDVDWVTLDSIDNITNQTFQLYNRHFYEEGYDFVRLRVNTDSGYGRACIDNFFVASPFASTIYIQNMTLTPEIPLNSDNVYVSADVYDTFLSPSNIELELVYQLADIDTYSPGTWGTYPSPTRLSMTYNESNSLYETTIPIGTPGGNPIDTVVQYYIEATFDGLFSDRSSPMQYKEFTNPDYYWPVDLNDGISSSNITPYYVVFSCLPGQVWINEINVADDYAYSGGNPLAISPTQFVEVCGISGVDIGDWGISTYAIDGSANVTPNSTYTIPPGTIIPNETNKFGFFVLGTTNMPESDLDMTNDLATPGGIHLVRSMGAVDHSICYDTEDDINLAVTNNQTYRFIYIGLENSYEDSALHATGSGSNLTDFASSYTIEPLVNHYGDYSPGRINNGQTLVAWAYTPTNDPAYAGSLAINSFWTTATSVHMVVSSDSSSLSMTPWYSTNLTKGLGWLQATNPGQTVSGTTYTVWCDIVTNVPGAFYRVTTE